MNTDKEAIELLLATGRGQQNIHENPEGLPFAILPGGSLLDLSSVYAPRNIRQTVTFQDAPSFAKYVNRFKGPNTLIFAAANETGAQFSAALDYHGAPDQPAWVKHWAKFNTLTTPDWNTWLAANRKPMTQVDFATWLEDNLKLFVSPEGSNAPSGADLLELVRSLHGHQNARFNTSLRLNTGAYSVAYEEEVEIKGASQSRGGSLELPPEIIAGIRIFQGGDAYMVRARLKTRIQERKLMLWFETISLADIVRDNVNAVVATVEAQTQLPVLMGSVA